MKSTESVFNFSSRIKYLVLFLIAFGFYANSLSNQYALDDEAVIQKNDDVQMGFRGIGKILSTDAYQNYYKRTNSNQMLSGGRYRPLSIVLFAIEHQLWGESPFMRHVVNVLLYCFCVLGVFCFLRAILPGRLPFGEDVAFISALLFAVHPIHSEVVANLKSSDEILSLLFIMLTLIFGITYRKTEKNRMLTASLLSFFCALLAKEYGLMLVFLMPLLFNLYFKETVGKSLRASLPWYGVIAFYLIIRFAFIGFPHQHAIPDVLNAPYLFATPVQHFASEIAVLGKYLSLLFFPYPLAYDYGYAQLPYHNFSSPAVWVAAVAYAVIIYAAFALWRKKNILAFPLFFFLLNLFMVSNFVLNIGATMGERLVFHSSLGFTTVVAFGLLTFPLLPSSVAIRRGIIILFLTAVVGLSFAETFERNRQWKNNFTLFTKDVKTVPNSVKANDNAGAQWINLCETIKDTVRSDSLARIGIQYLTKAITIDSFDVTGYMNLGVAYCKLIQPDSAELYWNKVVRLFPGWTERESDFSTLSQIYLYAGNRYAMRGEYRKSIAEMEHGIRCNPANTGLWFYLGGTFYNISDYDSARFAWRRLQQIDPAYPNLEQWLHKVQ